MKKKEKVDPRKEAEELWWTLEVTPVDPPFVYRVISPSGETYHIYHGGCSCKYSSLAHKKCWHLHAIDIYHRKRMEEKVEENKERKKVVSDA